MIFCITFLRAIAALIITNSHYTGVYPTDLLANGGLLGDVIFFAVSGFCLYNVKMKFGKWYFYRIVRIFPAVLIITVIYMILGLYPQVKGFSEAIKWFVYPTNYHFVASIIILYVPFYFVVKTEKLKDNIPWLMIGVFVIYLLAYVIMYDKSYYHIDNVREPMIRFLFFESMLLGAYFKHNLDKFKNMFFYKDWVLLIITFVLYFGTKIIFSRNLFSSELQIINQVFIFVLLFFVLKCALGVDAKLETMPQWIKKSIIYLSTITLEVYVVQYAIIPRLVGFMFPINWIVITSCIFVSASILHICVKFVNKCVDALLLNERRT